MAYVRLANKRGTAADLALVETGYAASGMSKYSRQAAHGRANTKSVGRFHGKTPWQLTIILKEKQNELADCLLEIENCRYENVKVNLERKRMSLISLVSRIKQLIKMREGQ